MQNSSQNMKKNPYEEWSGFPVYSGKSGNKACIVIRINSFKNRQFFNNITP